METAESFIIFGAGGHGRSVREAILAAGGSVAGFIDQAPGEGSLLLPDGLRLPVARDVPLVPSKLPFGASVVALGIGDNQARAEIARRMVGAHRMPAIVHPRASVAQDAQIGEGAVVLAAAVVGAGVRVGMAAVVNTGAVIDHDCDIGDGAHVSPGAVVCGGVTVGRRAWIGAGATVVPGVRVGDDAVVGAGAVVLQHLGAGVRAVGVPARPLRDPEGTQ